VRHFSSQKTVDKTQVNRCCSAPSSA